MLKTKRLISVLLFFAVIISSVYVFADDKKSDKIEIKLTVGQSTLEINGKDVEVETPYVLDGTTLVPLRVITEAFGAEVTWDEATRGITLVYSEVTIKLNIDSKTAYINNQVTELLQAPQLTNDTTMVPLRFVTENFGADVTYDDATSVITVVKTLSESSSIKDYSLILKTSAKEYVGDSFYNWYMPIPKDLSLSDRSFDGYYSEFSSADGNRTIEIVLIETDGTHNIDTVGTTLKDYAKNGTLIDHYKKTDSKNREYYYVKFKGKEKTYEYKGYIKNNIVYYAVSTVNNDANASEKQLLSDIISKFMLDYPKDNTVEDLSDITQDGYRIFEDKKMKVSLKIPSDWHKTESDDKENEFRFIKYDGKKFVGSVKLAIYSVDDAESTMQWANRDMQNNLDSMNPKCITESTPVEPIKFSEIEGYQYSLTIDSNNEKTIMKDIFFLCGNYRYNLTIDLSENTAKSKDYYNGVINSVKIDELDKEEIGKLLRYEEDNDVFRTFKHDNYNYSIDIPTTWKTDNLSGGTYFADEYNTYAVRINVTDNENKMGLDVLMEAFHKELKKQSNIQLEEKEKVKIGDYQMYLTKYIFTGENGLKTVVYDYTHLKNNKIYVVAFSTAYLADSKKTTELFDKMIKSFKVN